MAEWTIYSKNGVAKATVKELELHDEWMAECFVTVNVKAAEPIDFMVGDYIDYRNERYSINYDPSKIKKARRGTYGDGFVYDNIKFVAVQDEIVRCDFCDIVLSDNNIHYTQLSTFPFYCETVDDLLDRIQANMEELYPEDWIIVSPDLGRDRQRGLCVGREQAFVDAYNQYIGAGSQFVYEKTGVALTVDNINCWEALSKVHSDFDLNFIIRGRTVIVGTAGIFTANTFRYGKGNGLYEIEVIGDSEQQITTRLRAYGSEQNLPDRYYAEMNARPFFNVSYINPDSSTAQGISVLLDNKKFNNVFTNEVDSVADSQKIMIANCEMDGITFDAAFELINGSEGCTTRMLVGADGSVIITGYSLPTVPQSVIDALKAEMEVGSHIIFNNGVNKKYVDSSHIDYATTSLPDNMAVNRLMLPGFPEISLDAWVRANRPELIAQGFSFSTNPARPYIDSPNISKYGIRPSSIYFDGSDDNEDIHPTIEGMSWAGVRSDEVVSAEQMTDNGSLPEDAKEADKRVNITIPYAGFELNDLWVDGATISMKDGMCGARDFKIVKKPTKDDDGNWLCVCERNYDSTLHLYFPYNDFQIHQGDHFVLTGIELPSSYVEAASIRLFDAAMDALIANHEPRVTYQPRVDHVFMARQHDDAMASGGRTRSLHDTLKAGDMFVFQDSDLGINAAVTIDVLSIKENGDNGLPTYEVTLRDEKQVSTIQKLQNKVGSMFSGSINGAGGGGGGYNTNQLLSLIENLGREYFLSRQFDDSAAGNIEFKKDITVDGKTYADEIISSEYTGDGMLDTGYRLWYEDGRAKLVIDDLVARGKFSVYELETRIMTHAGGDVVFSGAGSKIFYVEYLNGNEDVLGYTTINSPWMLRGKMLLGGNTALAAWSNRKKIQKQLTDAEKAQVRKFRCYVVSDDGTTQTRNWWHVHDLARSQTFDHTQLKQTSEGYYSGTNVTNTVYWRRVAGIGSKEIEGIGDGKIHDYFDLWNVLDVSNETFIDEHGQEQTIGYDIPSEEYTTPGYDASYNDWPAAGDDVVQFGNARDKDRQAMVTIEVTGGEPGIQIYNGVHTYNMAQTKWVGIGYDKDTKHAYSDVFGDFYFGERGTRDVHDGSTYVRYRMDDGTPQHKPRLDIKAHITAESTYGDEDLSLEDYILDITWTKEDIEEMIGEGVEVVQKQVDGNFIVWYGDVTPTLNNDPASGWHTEALKQEHLYDMYYDRVAKLGYRFVTYLDEHGVEGYRWEQVRDISIISSLAAAESAQDTADNKRRVFICDYVTKMHPDPPYDEGDLWVNADWIDPTTHEVIFDNDLVRCNHTRTTGSFSISDWEKASKYTDDSRVNSFIENTYNPFVTDIQSQVDGKAETWYQATNPANSWTTVNDKKKHVGDLWYCTADIPNTDYKKGTTWFYKMGGTAQNPTFTWEQQDVPEAVFDTIDGKAEIFVGDTLPIIYNVNDMWIIGDNVADEDMPTGCKARDIVVSNAKSSTYNKSHWSKRDRYTDDSGLTSFLTNTYAVDKTNILSQIDQKAETWYQSTDPSTAWTTTELKNTHKGDIWHNTSNQTINGVGPDLDAIWSGTAWVVSDVPQGVYDKIDGKADIFVSKPSAYNKFDMWIIEDGLSSADIPTGCKAGDIVIADNMPSGTTKRTTYVKTDWQKKDRYTDDSAFNAYINEVINGTGASGNAKTVADAARVLNGALKAKTEMDGGLMLTSTLVMRNKNNDDTYTTWGGLNGVYSSGSTIAAWFGGGMVDHVKSPSASGYATSLFRMDGSGYVAGGNIQWDETGTVSIQGNLIRSSSIYIGETDITNLFITKDWFDQLFQVYDNRTRIESNGTFPQDRSNVNIKSMFGFWTEFYLSAQGGGGQTSLNIYLAQLGDVNTSGVQAGEYLMYDGTRWVSGSGGGVTSLANLTDVNVTGVTNGQALVYDSSIGKWIPGVGGVDMSAVWNALSTSDATKQIDYSHLSGAISISGNTITIGSSTITPITSLTGYATQQWVSDQGFASTSWVSNNFLSLSNGTLILTNTNDASPTSYNSPALVVGGTSSQAHIEMDANEIIAKSDETHSTTLWLNDKFGVDSDGNGIQIGNVKLVYDSSHNAIKVVKSDGSAANFYATGGVSAQGAGEVSGGGYLPIGGGTMTGILNVATGKGIEDASGNGLLVYHPTDWSGISSSQWGVGAIGSQGVIRSSDQPLIHYRGGVNYEILDTKGGQTISGALKIGEINIERTDEINRYNGELFLQHQAGTGNIIMCKGGGYVGVNERYPTYRLQVYGTAASSGGWVDISDMRRKNKKADIKLTVEQVAEAPSFVYTLKKREGEEKSEEDNKEYVGTSAQYWQDILPQAVDKAKDKDGTLSLNYGATALASVKPVAKKALENEKKINALKEKSDAQEKEIEELKHEIAELKSMLNQILNGHGQ